eukprot:6183244-Pleurochrysis_carterae.AAC.2
MSSGAARSAMALRVRHKARAVNAHVHRAPSGGSGGARLRLRLQKAFSPHLYPRGPIWCARACFCRLRCLGWIVSFDDVSLRVRVRVPSRWLALALT